MIYVWNSYEGQGLFLMVRNFVWCYFFYQWASSCGSQKLVFWVICRVYLSCPPEPYRPMGLGFSQLLRSGNCSLLSGGAIDYLFFRESCAWIYTCNYGLGKRYCPCFPLGRAPCYVRFIFRATHHGTDDQWGTYVAHLAALANISLHNPSSNKACKVRSVLRFSFLSLEICD